MDFDSFEKSDLEKLLRIVNHHIKLSNVKTIEKFLSTTHENKKTVCSFSSKYRFCPSFSFQQFGEDWSKCTCPRGFGVTFDEINFSSPVKVRLLINFLKNTNNVSFFQQIIKKEWDEEEKDYVINCNCNFHIDIETLKAEIASLRNTKCKKIVFFTGCVCKNVSISRNIVKDLSTIINWNFEICYENIFYNIKNVVRYSCYVMWDPLKSII